MKNSVLKSFLLVFLLGCFSYLNANEQEKDAFEPKGQLAWDTMNEGNDIQVPLATDTILPPDTTTLPDSIPIPPPPPIPQPDSIP